MAFKLEEGGREGKGAASRNKPLKLHIFQGLKASPFGVPKILGGFRLSQDREYRYKVKFSKLSNQPMVWLEQKDDPTTFL